MKNNNNEVVIFGLIILILGLIFIFVELYIINTGFQSFLTYLNIFFGIILMILGNIMIWSEEIIKYFEKRK